MESSLKNEMKWFQKKWLKVFFELSSGGNIIGNFRENGLFNSLSEGEISGKHYCIHQTGFIDRSIAITDTGTGENSGKMKIVWVGKDNGTLILPVGKKYTWKCNDFFRDEWIWIDPEDGREIIRIKSDNFISKQKGSLKITDTEIPEDELNLLIITGLYLKLFFSKWTKIVAIILIILIARGGS